MAGSGFGTVAFVVTKFRYRKKTQKSPSGRLHCLSWCCGFCYASFALLFGGVALVFGVTAGESCVFARLEIFSDSLVEHRHALGLVASSGDYSQAVSETISTVAIDLVASCFVPNGTGDLLAAMRLREPLAFQSELSASFLALEERVAESPIGRDTIEQLDSLRRVAAAFGDLFVLDPLPLPSSGSDADVAFSSSDSGSEGGSVAADQPLGILELSSNVRDLLLGSTIGPEDRKGPEQSERLRGLNSYASLIAGPGKYAFEHGTAGGGFVITAVRPTRDEMQSLPAVVRNALLYGRAKEKLLSSNSSIRCDELGDDGRVQKKSCSVRAFHDYVQTEVARIEAASASLSDEAAAVQGLFLSELNKELLPTLRKVRDLRTIFDCSLLWERAGEVHGSLCEGLAPLAIVCSFQLFFLSLASGVGVVVQYKVWRHLKDNKIVKAEMLRFQWALGRFEQDMARIQGTIETPRRLSEKQAYSQHMVVQQSDQTAVGKHHDALQF
eukprot:TRINITY_DN40740_c0_g1_i1.p1 TRINITY_DN40740_c0_g1~~TRINITY_DN40740_c0_g1_i1.p1  ORF type:complete len:556 (+),score=108.81 TRINITY_DN40740_c0_g1_i1:177-1670(+)